MIVSILTIGEEITTGNIINTNASWLAEKLTEVGAEVIKQSSVPDDAEMMKAELDSHLELANLVIMTGGLGPTKDDITKQMLCDYFIDELKLHEGTLTRIEELFKARGIMITERNREQAYLPSKAKILPNRVGTAPGMLLETNGKYLISMPGVPSEMKAITVDHVIPYAKNIMDYTASGFVRYEVLQTAGIPESLLADLVEGADEGMNASFAYLPNYQGVRLRLKARSDTFKNAGEILDKLKKEMYKRAGKYIFAEGAIRLAEFIGMELAARKMTLSVAESCTAGMLGAELTKAAGSSSFFEGGVISYSNDVKAAQLGVSQSTLDIHGAVSSECAKAMASNCRDKFKTDLAISITGIAGPGGGSTEKPVGLVYIALAAAGEVTAKRYLLGNSERSVIRERSVGMALLMLLKYLKGIQS